MTKRSNVIIVGAGVAGRELAGEIDRHFSKKYKIVGFLDDNKKLFIKKIQGIKVLGPIKDLPKFIKKYDIVEVFIAIPSANGSLIREVMKNCDKQNVTFKIVPRLLEIIEGKVNLSRIREVEIEDLLGREIVQSEQLPFKKEFKNKTVLVTGAAGSIGSEICRQILSFKPKKLIALDMWESGLYELGLELGDIGGGKFKCVVANIRDKERIEEIFNAENPDIVFHAAAYKHVPLMQDFPNEAVKNNVFGTKNVIQSSIKSGVQKFVNISTDKAVEPTNVMGVTKLLSEKLVTYFNSENKTKFSSVRFGNVLGSQGSVVPTFKKQIAKGGPVTVTDKRMTRYFMTIPEAVQLVLYAELLVKEGGEVFMLDMGEPVKIDELARLMIRLSGFVPDIDIKIKYSGVRTGEKLEEKLTNDSETKTETENKRIFLIKGKKERFDINKIIRELSLRLKSGKSLEPVLKHIAPGLTKMDN